MDAFFCEVEYLCRYIRKLPDGNHRIMHYVDMTVYITADGDSVNELRAYEYTVTDREIRKVTPLYATLRGWSIPSEL